MTTKKLNDSNKTSNISFLFTSGQGFFLLKEEELENISPEYVFSLALNTYVNLLGQLQRDFISGKQKKFHGEPITECLHSSFDRLYNLYPEIVDQARLSTLGVGVC